MRTRGSKLWLLAAGVMLLTGVLLFGGKSAMAAEIAVAPASAEQETVQPAQPNTVPITQISNQKRWIVLKHPGLDKETQDGKTVERYVYLRRAKGQKKYHVIGQYVLNKKEQAQGSKLEYAVRDVEGNNGCLYRYQVGILYTDGSEGLSKTVRMCRLTRPTYRQISSKHRGCLGLWWQPNRKADGYCVYFGTSEKELFDEIHYKHVTSGDTTKATLCNLKPGQKYYVYVKAYKDVGGKRYYSARSKVASITIKK